MTKVVHLQFSTSSGGSAALRLHKAFRNAKIDSTILSLHHDKSSNEKIKHLGRLSRLIAKIDSKLQEYLKQNTRKQYGLFSYPILGSNVAKIPELKNADFIYIHWVLHGFLNFQSIEQLAKLNKPIIFFMHDMWPITGGCHQSFTCEKYMTNCFDCQIFPGRKRNDLSHVEFDKKLKLYSKYNNFYFVSPSKWLYECAKKSLLTKTKPIFYIPNVLDNTIFKPFDKKTAKKILNIDPSEIVIAFGAVSLASPYKGWGYLQKALELLPKDKNISVLIFGSSHQKEIADAIPFKIKFMGYLEDEYSTNLIYNAADVFVAPSIAETFGYVIMEALSCGTPVVAFDVGGIPDQIKHKYNGYLAQVTDSADLANGINFCLTNQMTGYTLPIFDTKNILKKHWELFDYIETQFFKHD